MATRFMHLLIDSADPRPPARFWADALGWEVTSSEPGEAVVMPAGADYLTMSDVPLVFVPVPEPKTAKNRVHIDLATASLDHQAELTERLLGLGAIAVDIGQGDVPWRVLADPFGNEFCVLEPRPVYRDTGPVAAIVVDCVDADAMARFWSAAAGWPIGAARDGVIPLRSPDGTGPYLEMLPVGEPKRVKNRVHLDIAPFPGDDQAAEVARLAGAGARPADVGQRDVSWIVLADPEGQEFCVLSPR